MQLAGGNTLTAAGKLMLLDGTDGIVLTPAHVQTLRTLFNIAYRLNAVLGPSWALVLDVFNTLDLVLKLPRTTTQVGKCIDRQLPLPCSVMMLELCPSVLTLSTTLWQCSMPNADLNQVSMPNAGLDQVSMLVRFCWAYYPNRTVSIILGSRGTMQLSIYEDQYRLHTCCTQELSSSAASPAKPADLAILATAAGQLFASTTAMSSEVVILFTGVGVMYVVHEPISPAMVSHCR